MKLSNSELVVSTYHSNIERAREILKKYDNLNLQESLSELKRQDIENEGKK